MVILHARSGQLANRLFMLGTFIGNAIENGHEIICAGFEEYYHLFENINKACSDYKVEFIEPKEKLRSYGIDLASKLTNNIKLFSRISNHYKYSETGDINTSFFIESAKHKKMHVKGWPYWDVDNFIKHADVLRKIFVPKEQYQKNALAFLKKINAPDHVFVGVHIRQGDYKEYLDGQYYFTIEEYIKVIMQIQEQLINKGLKPFFIICSNVKVELGAVTFPYIISDLDAMSDIVLLSKCDYIIGPPSTFSQWSSFYGQVPSNVIRNKIDPIKLADFSPIAAPNTYISGRHLKDPN